MPGSEMLGTVMVGVTGVLTATVGVVIVGVVTVATTVGVGKTGAGAIGTATVAVTVGVLIAGAVITAVTAGVLTAGIDTTAVTVGVLIAGTETAAVTAGVLAVGKETEAVTGETGATGVDTAGVPSVAVTSGVAVTGAGVEVATLTTGVAAATVTGAAVPGVAPPDTEVAKVVAMDTGVLPSGVLPGAAVTIPAGSAAILTTRSGAVGTGCDRPGQAGHGGQGHVAASVDLHRRCVTAAGWEDFAGFYLDNGIRAGASDVDGGAALNEPPRRSSRGADLDDAVRHLDRGTVLIYDDREARALDHGGEQGCFNGKMGHARVAAPYRAWCRPVASGSVKPVWACSLEGGPRLAGATNDIIVAVGQHCAPPLAPVAMTSPEGPARA